VLSAYFYYAIDMSSTKIIYFQPWGGLGDALLSTPALEAIKARYPEALIYCHNSSFYHSLLEFNPHIHQFLPSYKGLIKTPEDKLENIINKLNGKEAIFNPCYGALRPSLRAKPLHAIDIICRMVGLTPAEQRVKIHLSPEDEQSAQAIIQQIGQPVIVLHTQATCAQSKEWYPERWAKVVGWLRDKGYKVMQLGGEDSLPIPGAINLLGQTGIRQALALLKQARCFLGIDSVFNHAAHGFGVRGVVLFGASTPEIWGYAENINIYKGLKCQPCIDLLQDKCHARRCMQQISVEEVIQALESVVT
jgi:ADP-heptose:LPS heptosyltransferase